MSYLFECGDATLPALALAAGGSCDGSAEGAPSAGPALPSSCDQELAWVHALTDKCGNKANVTEAIKVNDIAAPTPPEKPADEAVACLSDTPAAFNLTTHLHHNKTMFAFAQQQLSVTFNPLLKAE